MKPSEQRKQELVDHLKNNEIALVKTAQGGKHPHKGYAVLKDVTGDVATIQPFRHKKLEHVPVDRVVPNLGRSRPKAQVAESAPPPAENHTQAPQPPAEVSCADDVMAALELYIERAFKRMEEPQRQSLAIADVGTVLRELLLGSDDTHFKRFYKTAKKETHPTWGKERFRDWLGAIAVEQGEKKVAEVFRSLKSFVPEPVIVKKEAPKASALPKPDVPAPAHAVAKETKFAAVAELCGDEETRVNQALRNVLRRLVRDHGELGGEEKRSLEHAILGAENPNELLDLIEVDAPAAKLLSQVYGISMTPEQVKSRRLELLAASQRTVSPLEAMEAALAEGSLSVADVIGALLRHSPHQTPSALALHIVEHDLAETPDLEAAPTGAG